MLNGAVFNELVNLLRPGLADVASVHEAGHVAMSYLVGCPISTYSLGDQGVIVPIVSQPSVRAFMILKCRKSISRVRGGGEFPRSHSFVVDREVC